jgi:hypothetical protein
MPKLKRRIERIERNLPSRVKSHPTQVDEDALQIYEMNFYLSGTVHPDWLDLMGTPIGIRPEGIRTKDGPIIPGHLCQGWSETTAASANFCIVSCVNRLLETCCAGNMFE